MPKRVPWLWNIKPPEFRVRLTPDDLVEIYSPPRLTPAASALGLVANLSIDLETGWDLSAAHQKVCCVEEVMGRAPLVLVLSPPCTMHSALYNWNWWKMVPSEREKKFLRNHGLLEFACLLADLQHNAGRFFILEHPVTATSWQSPRVVDLKELAGVQAVEFDQCMLGLKSPSGVPTKKRTRILTNLPGLATDLSKCQCDKSHEHKTISGKDKNVRMSEHAQKYPDMMVKMICDAVLMARTERRCCAWSVVCCHVCTNPLSCG